MSKEIYISSTPHETRLAIVENDDLAEIYYERENEYTLAGSIYNGKVTRVLPGMQSSFVDIGLERDAFLYITDFLEEAGESAEFDAGEGGERRNRGRGDRGGRSGAPVSEAAGPSDEAEPAARGERRGRGRSRDERAGTPRPEPPVAREAFTEAPLADQSAVAAGTPSAGEPRSEVAEDAGAEGSRRWRGRRGRRRGRGPGGREAGPTLTSGAEEQGQAEPENQAGAEEFLELGAAAEDRAADEVYASPDTTPERSSELESPYVDAYGTGEESGVARDRGDRGGRRDRRERDRRAPRGFAPSRSQYGLEEGGESAGEAAGEPIVLPGESLAKYRPGAKPEVATEAAQPAPTPAVDFVLPGAWSGGAVMPGETLRPRTGDGGSNRPERSSEGSGDRGSRRDRGDRGGRPDRRPERESRPERGQRPEGSRQESAAHRAAVAMQVSMTAPHQEVSSLEEIAELASLAEPAGVLDAGPAVAGLPESSTTEMQGQSGLPEQPGLHEQSGHGASSDQEGHSVLDVEGAWAQPEASAAEERASSTEGSELATSAAEAPVHGMEHGEYEPTEASASHRFDPAPPREYRQSVLAPEGEQEIDRNAATAEEAETAPDPATSTHRITPPAGTVLRPLVAESSEVQDVRHEPAHTAASDELPSHEFTAVTPGGDMLSEPVVPLPQEVAEPAAPIQHETAVLESEAPADLSGVALGGVATDEETETGMLETEQPEGETEEDFQTTTLHASAIEEIDYDEEETLEGAADLGTMIREMSIDEITAPGDEAEEQAGYDEEEVAFEEQDATEDAEAYASFDENVESASEEISGGNGAEMLETERTHAGDDAAPEEGRGATRDSGFAGRRHGRRDGRRPDRGGDRGGERRDDRARNTGGSGERSTGIRTGRRDHRHSAQTTNLPAISDLLKPGQELLVQIAKEPIAKKGARITSHIALPGRFLVFMPTVNHTGVSRKIESDGERRRLKEILLSEKGDATGGFIVRTAASGASEEELRSDLRFLLNLWADIKQRSESSKSPALIYHDLNLVERILRDQVTDNFSAIWVDTESEYERVLRFLQRFQPSLIRRVKLYTKDAPLFEQFGLQEEINKALRSKVWLKSGGSIVINQTEALVAIDINTGKYVGKTARLEDTIVKTNLDAIPEIVRQIRLRDLGGIIIIDFIDMDERKNRYRVMEALEEELKKDRAPSKVLQFNDFGLVAITRKRVKQSLERTLSTTCGVCTGTGMVKSPVTVCNEIYVEMRKMQKHLDRGDVMLRVNPEVVKQLKSPTAKWLQEMEEMVGKTILVKSDPTLHPEQFDIH